MDKDELTEGQIRLFLEYGTIPAGYNKEKMVELTENRNKSITSKYAYKNILLGKNVYHFCEICGTIVNSTFISVGQRYPGRYRVMRSRFAKGGYSSNDYCYICHKSMCDSCKAGIVCKNCIEFFPDTTQNEIMKRHKLISKIKLIFGPLILLFFISYFTDTFLFQDFDIPTYVYLAYLYISFIPFFIFLFVLRKYFQDTVEEFFKELKRNPQNHEDITKKVYSLYYDSYDHTENLFNTAKYAKIITFLVLILIFPLILILFSIFGS